MNWVDIPVSQIIFYAVMFVSFCFGFLSSYRP